MGYYVDGYGAVEVLKEDEDRLVQELKDLNHRHELKTGGRFPKTGDPYEDSWFAWVPNDYHKNDELTTVKSIMEMLGFNVREQDEVGRVSLSMDYSDKTGAEHVFLRALAEAGADVSFEWTGEEHERWMVRSKNNRLETRSSYLSWGEWVPDEDAGPIAHWNQVIGEVVDAFK